VTAPSPGRQLGEAHEAIVIALAMRGDSAAFNELVRRRQAWLRNFLRRLCRDPALADDLAQQSLLQAWRSLPALKSAAAFTAWLRRLAINTWLQHLRTAGNALATRLELPTEPALPAMAGLQLDLDQALAQLREDVRLCVVLAYHEGLSHLEIAAVMALPLGTVKSHVTRGSAQLRSMLDAYASPTGELHAGELHER
jgi:RNA polymerase sigma-70 factor (ECF subfamily)